MLYIEDSSFSLVACSLAARFTTSLARAGEASFEILTRIGRSLSRRGLIRAADIAVAILRSPFTSGFSRGFEGRISRV